MTRQPTETREPAEILSSRDRATWSVTAPAILTPRERSSDDAAAGMVKTLFDHPRWLEPCHLYDERGSLLFEEICESPEYYPTRTESAILEREAGALMSLAPVECIVGARRRFLEEDHPPAQGADPSPGARHVCAGGRQRHRPHGLQTHGR